MMKIESHLTQIICKAVVIIDNHNRFSVLIWRQGSDGCRSGVLGNRESWFGRSRVREWAVRCGVESEGLGSGRWRFPVRENGG